MKRSWAFMKDHMPQVVALLRDKRQAGQGAHVDLCWRRGVVEGLPGWFYASEGGVQVGTLSVEAAQQVLERLEAAQPGQSVAPLLVLRPVGAGDGAH